MPKPQTKKELLSQSQENYSQLMALIDNFPKSDLSKEFSGNSLNRNIRDILAHLHHWHLLMKQWYDIGMKGEKPAMPSEGYTWKTVPQLNIAIWEKYQSASLKTIRNKLDASYNDMQLIINSKSNKDLFTKQKYYWTGSTSLGVYLISNTSSHYMWAIKQIKKGMK